MWRLSIIIRRAHVAISAIHPGEHLAEELKERGMSAAELARQLDVPTNHVTEILHGRRTITGDTALRLAHFFSTTAEFGLTCKVSASRQGAKEGREIDQPTAHAEANRGSPCVGTPPYLIDRAGCGCKCGCTMLQIASISQRFAYFSVRARLS
jgi:addiction module HigA family antidote